MANKVQINLFNGKSTFTYAKLIEISSKVSDALILDLDGVFGPTTEVKYNLFGRVALTGNLALVQKTEEGKAESMTDIHGLTAITIYTGADESSEAGLYYSDFVADLKAHRQLLKGDGGVKGLRKFLKDLIEVLESFLELHFAEKKFGKKYEKIASSWSHSSTVLARVYHREHLALEEESTNADLNEGEQPATYVADFDDTQACRPTMEIPSGIIQD